MSGITDINELLGSMQPALVDELFVSDDKAEQALSALKELGCK